MNKLSQINKIYISEFHIYEVYSHLQEAGKRGVEGVALWMGTFKTSTEFIVQTTRIPEQKAFSTEEGLLYIVGEQELERINLWLYENKQILLAQIHSHPGRAYHSETDDAYPIVARIGGISIVIPNFGFNGFSLDDFAVYRLDGNGWNELTMKEIQDLIHITV